MKESGESTKYKSNLAIQCIITAQNIKVIQQSSASSLFNNTRFSMNSFNPAVLSNLYRKLTLCQVLEKQILSLSLSLSLSHTHTHTHTHTQLSSSSHSLSTREFCSLDLKKKEVTEDFIKPAAQLQIVQIKKSIFHI